MEGSNHLVDIESLENEELLKGLMIRIGFVCRHVLQEMTVDTFIPNDTKMLHDGKTDLNKICIADLSYILEIQFDHIIKFNSCSIALYFRKN